MGEHTGIAWTDATQNFWRGCTKVLDHIRWVIIGGESGPDPRPMEIKWVEDILYDCRDQGVNVFVKQDAGPRPGMRGRIPDHLWVQEMPQC